MPSAPSGLLDMVKSSRPYHTGLFQRGFRPLPESRALQHLRPTYSRAFFNQLTWTMWSQVRTPPQILSRNFHPVLGLQKKILLMGDQVQTRTSDPSLAQDLLKLSLELPSSESRSKPGHLQLGHRLLSAAAAATV